MNNYDKLDYHKTQFKSSHNSYERDENLKVQLAWNEKEKWQSGCRGIELDIWRHSDNTQGTSSGYFTVAHTIPGKRPLADYLSDLLSFHADQETHDPIWVTLDIKSEKGDVQPFPGEIDAYLSEWFDANLIFRPSKLRQNSQLSLLDNVRKTGWPKISELKGKFIFCLSGNEAWKSLYADKMTEESLCFADFDVSDDKSFEVLEPTLPTDRIVLNMHWKDESDKWEASTKELLALGYLTRAYLFNSESIWSKGKKASINILATDKVRNHEWACVGSEPFVLI